MSPLFERLIKPYISDEPLNQIYKSTMIEEYPRVFNTNNSI